MPPSGVYADRPVGFPGADADPAEMDELSEAIRLGMSPRDLRADLIADGWRWLSPGTCDTDAYTGLGTPYPNHPDPEQTVDGALATVTSARGETYDVATTGVYANNAMQLVAEGVGWDVFTAGRRLFGYRAANARLASSEANLVEAQFNTALQTTSAFCDSSHGKNPLRAAARMPLALSVITRNNRSLPGLFGVS